MDAEFEPLEPERDFDFGAIRESLRVKPKYSQGADVSAVSLEDGMKGRVEAAGDMSRQTGASQVGEQGTRTGLGTSEAVELESGQPAESDFDPITPFLDGELPSYPVLSHSMTEPKKHEPLRPHAVAPGDRSKRLSNLHRVSTAPRETVTASEVYHTYTNTYFSAARGQSLTPAELRGVTAQLNMLQSDPRRLDDSTQHYKRIDELVRHLLSTSNGGEEFAERMRLRVRPTAVSKTSDAYVDEISRGMETIMSLRGNKSLIDIKPDIDFFMRMLVDSTYGRSQFQLWWDRFSNSGLQMDGHSFKTRLLFLLRANRDSEVHEMIQYVFNSNMTNQIVLLNAAMNMFAEEHRWDIVSGLYTSVVPTSTVSKSAPLDNPLSIFDIPSILRPSRKTFTGIIDLLAYAGYLVPSLIIMQDMLKYEHAPHIDVYLSLFQGFAAYGQIGRSGGEAASLFPEIARISPGRVKSLRRTKEALRGPSRKSGTFAFTDIWAMGAAAPPRHTQAHANHALPPHMETEQKTKINE